MPITITSEQLTAAGVGAELRRNHHRNPGAEGTTLPLELVSGGTLTRATTAVGTMPASGSAFFDLTASGTAASVARTALAGRAACSAGQVWAAKIVGHNPAAGTRTFQLALQFYNLAPGATLGSVLLNVTQSQTVTAATGFSLEVGAIAPAGALSVGIEVSRLTAGAATGDRFLFDQLQLERLPTGGLLGAYFDGDRVDTAEAIYSWAGAQYDTASVLYAPARASISPTLMLELASSRPARSTASTIVGSSASYVALQPAGLRTGTHRLLFDVAGPSSAAATAAEETSRLAEQLLASGATFTLTYPERPSMEMRFAVLGDVVRTLAVDRRRWLLDFDYQELPV